MIKKMGGNGRAEERAMDPSFSQNGLKHYRQLIHMKWMIKLVIKPPPTKTNK